MLKMEWKACLGFEYIREKPQPTVPGKYIFVNVGPVVHGRGE